MINRMDGNLYLSEINIYPVKSLGGISLNSAEAGERGLKYDRRFLLVDENNQFITQRVYPQMALLKLSLEENHFNVTKKNSSEEILIPFEITPGISREVTIWGDKCEAISAGRDINEWFSRSLGVRCSLVYMPDTTMREVEKDYGAEGKTVSFADAYPYLIIGQSSLEDLNSRLQTPVPMNRFRTNFVFEGGEAFAEDSWDEFYIGSVLFKRLKPCARCVITTTDQETAERSDEPLRTLSRYRNFGGKVMFGQNLISLTPGEIHLGDKIEIC